MNAKTFLCLTLSLFFISRVTACCLLPPLLPKPSLLSILSDLRAVKQFTLVELLGLLEKFKQSSSSSCSCQGEPIALQPQQCQAQPQPIVAPTCQAQAVQIPIQLVHYVKQHPHTCPHRPVCHKRCTGKIANALNKMCLHFSSEKCDN